MSAAAYGVNPRAVTAMLDRFDAEGIVLHGLLIRRHGKTVAEGYWAPFHAGSLHRMYSVSKSFTSLAIGLLAAEGKIGLDEPVATYFPDKLPESPHPYTLQATVRDLLRMATPNSVNSYTVEDKDWLKTFFHMKPSHPPGTIFSYDTAGTTVLAALVERQSGVSLLDYLRPRLLDPVGFSKDARCVLMPEGHMWGGSGFLCTLRDMAAVAQVCLDGGMWQGKRLLPEDYIRAATQRQIDNSESGAAGYGYQIWCRPQGFQFNGMGSQFAFCYPQKGLIIACIGDTQLAGPRAGALITDAFERLAETVVAESLSEDQAGDAQLSQRLSSLRLAHVAGALHDPCQAQVDATRYRLNENPMAIEEITLSFAGDEGVFAYKKSGAAKSICFGLGRLVEGRFPEIYFGRRIGEPAEEPYRCLASAAWLMPGHLCLYIHITDDYLGALRVDIVFKDEQVSLRMMKAAEWFLEDYQGFAGGLAAK